MKTITDSHQIFQRLYPDMLVKNNQMTLGCLIVDQNTGKIAVLEYIPIYDERAVPNIPTEELVFCEDCEDYHRDFEQETTSRKLSEEEIQQKIKEMEQFIHELVAKLKEPSTPIV